MTLHLNLDHDSRVYFTLTCDRCGLPFNCYDDACYGFTSLRTEAVYAGWDAATRPEQPTYCPSCVHTDKPRARHGSCDSWTPQDRKDRPREAPKRDGSKGRAVQVQAA